MHPSGIMCESSKVSIFTGESGNIWERFVRSMKGRHEVLKSNKQMPEKHASEKRGEVGCSCLVKAATGLDSTTCTKSSSGGKLLNK